MIDTTLMTWVDWTIVSVLVASIGLSLWRGFTREALSLLGWILGFVIASRYSLSLAVYFNGLVSSAVISQVLAFLTVMALCLIAAALVARLMKSLLVAVGLSFFDRFLGSVFGFVRGIVILLIASYALTLLMPQSQQAMQNSVLMPYIDTLLDWSQSKLQDARVSTI
ncbi:MAG TPA: colicin V production protein [Halieaceae bacterium]|nr:colicin V production protein [Halieaceae bacterium]